MDKVCSEVDKKGKEMGQGKLEKTAELLASFPTCFLVFHHAFNFSQL